MKIVAMTRCRDESRWLRRVLESWLPLVEHVYLLDDGSTDSSAEIAASIPNVTVWPMPEGMPRNEAAHKSWLTARVVKEAAPTWILHCDSDELLTSESIPAIRAELDSPVKCLSFHIKYLWDREDQWRTDGVYGRCHRQSMFRPEHGAIFRGDPPGLHCGNVPMSLWGSCAYPAATLLHYGYLHREDRIRKYRWYVEQSLKHGQISQLQQEGGYKHIVQGDVPEVPADATLMHAGPLRLEPLTPQGVIIST